MGASPGDPDLEEAAEMLKRIPAPETAVRASSHKAPPPRATGAAWNFSGAASHAEVGRALERMCASIQAAKQQPSVPNGEGKKTRGKATRLSGAKNGAANGRSPVLEKTVISDGSTCGTMWAKKMSLQKSACVFIERCS